MNGKFDDAFTDICTRALEGDCVAQDCVAYFFNKGFAPYLQPNYDLYMSWQILAVANGNCFAMEKMEFFLKFAIDEIFEDEKLLKRALLRGNIDKNNALFVISNLLCEAVVDILDINAKNLVKSKIIEVQYSPEINRKYLKALENSIGIVKEFLAS